MTSKVPFNWNAITALPQAGNLKQNSAHWSFIKADPAAFIYWLNTG